LHAAIFDIEKLLFRSKIRTDQVVGSFQLAKSWPRMKSSLAQLKPVHMDEEEKKKSRRKGMRKKLYSFGIGAGSSGLALNKQHLSRDLHEHRR
jgi:hypothetical protein